MGEVSAKTPSLAASTLWSGSYAGGISVVASDICRGPPKTHMSTFILLVARLYGRTQTDKNPRSNVAGRCVGLYDLSGSL